MATLQAKQQITSSRSAGSRGAFGSIAQQAENAASVAKAPDITPLRIQMNNGRSLAQMNLGILRDMIDRYHASESVNAVSDSGPEPQASLPDVAQDTISALLEMQRLLNCLSDQLFG